MVMYAPGGIASLIMMNLRVAAHRKLVRLLGWYVVLAATALVMLAGAAALIELIYHLQLGGTLDTKLRVAGLPMDTHSAGSWLGALAVMLVSYAMFDFTRRRFARVWGQVQGEIEAENARKEGR